MTLWLTWWLTGLLCEPSGLPSPWNANLIFSTGCFPLSPGFTFLCFVGQQGEKSLQSHWHCDSFHCQSKLGPFYSTQTGKRSHSWLTKTLVGTLLILIFLKHWCGYELQVPSLPFHSMSNFFNVQWVKDITHVFSPIEIFFHLWVTVR